MLSQILAVIGATALTLVVTIGFIGTTMKGGRDPSPGAMLAGMIMGLALMGALIAAVTHGY